MVVFVATASETGRYAALSVESVHGVQPPAEAARRDGNLDDVRELPLSGFPAGAAFVATHRPIFCLSPALAKPRMRGEAALSTSKRRPRLLHLKGTDNGAGAAVPA